MPFAFLMPAFEALYLPFGFTYIFAKPEWQLNEEGMLSLKKVPFSPDNAEVTAQWTNQWLGNRYDIYALRDCVYIEKLQKEIESEKGVMELLYKNEELAGIKADWGVTEREQRLLFGRQEYLKKTGNGKPCIMGRILDLPEFVKVIRLQKEAEEELNLMLEVHDGQLKENEGIWRWHLDKKSSYIEKSMGARDGLIPDLVLDIGELTAWLTGYTVPEAVEPYAGKIRSLKGVFLDEIV